MERISEGKKREISIQSITAYETRVRNWCRQIFPDDPALTQEVAEQALVRLLSRRKQAHMDNLGIWVSLTTWKLCLERIKSAKTPGWSEEIKPESGLEPTDLPWRQAIKIINGLEEERRIGMKLKDLRGFRYEEIARAIGQTAEQARAHVIKGQRGFLTEWYAATKPSSKEVLGASRQSLIAQLEKELKVVFSYVRAQVKECPDEIQLLHHFTGTLPPLESTAVDRHIQVCGTCDLLLNRIAGLKEEDLQEKPTKKKKTKEQTMAIAQAQPQAASTQAAAPAAFAAQSAARASQPAALSQMAAQPGSQSPPTADFIVGRLSLAASRAETIELDEIRAAFMRATNPALKSPPEDEPYEPLQPARQPSSLLYNRVIWWILLIILLLSGVIYWLRHS